MLVPIVQIGLAGLGISVSYSVDTKEIVYAACAGPYQKFGTLYAF
jgi:hypothetical protein